MALNGDRVSGPILSELTCQSSESQEFKFVSVKAYDKNFTSMEMDHGFPWFNETEAYSFIEARIVSR